MKQDVNLIIELLEQAQALIHKGEHNKAETAVYEAQCLAIFMRDIGLSKQNKHRDNPDGCN